eukprot:scaffold949_cov404-Prasinococcus_capsulatus_cf.AAC.4
MSAVVVAVTPRWGSPQSAGTGFVGSSRTCAHAPHTFALGPGARGAAWLLSFWPKLAVGACLLLHSWEAWGGRAADASVRCAPASHALHAPAAELPRETVLPSPNESPNPHFMGFRHAMPVASTWQDHSWVVVPAGVPCTDAYTMPSQVCDPAGLQTITNMNDFQYALRSLSDFGDDTTCGGLATAPGASTAQIEQAVGDIYYCEIPPAPHTNVGSGSAPAGYAALFPCGEDSNSGATGDPHFQCPQEDLRFDILRDLTTRPTKTPTQTRP